MLKHFRAKGNYFSKTLTPWKRPGVTNCPPSGSQWPTGPWIRPTSSGTKWLPGPTKCHRQAWRGWRTSPRRPDWWTRSVIPVTMGYTDSCHKMEPSSYIKHNRELQAHFSFKSTECFLLLLSNSIQITHKLFKMWLFLVKQQIYSLYNHLKQRKPGNIKHLYLIGDINV